MEQAMTSVIVARAATLLIKYTFIGFASITLGVLAFGVMTGLLAELTDLRAAMSAFALITSASPPRADIPRPMLNFRF